jgi:hypothetical protein
LFLNSAAQISASVHAPPREWQLPCTDLLQVPSVAFQNDERIGHAGRLQVGFNAFEFVLHFEEFVVPGIATAGPFAIVVPPATARVFAATLAESLAEYEQRFGKIPEMPK